MPGYFDNLLESYRPPASPVLPDAPRDNSPELSADVEQMAPVPPSEDFPAAAEPDAPTLSAPKVEPDHAPAPLAPGPADDVPTLSPSEDDSRDESGSDEAPPPARAAEASGFDENSLPAAGDEAPPVPGEPDVSVETTNHFSETHIYETVQVFESDAEAQDIPAPPAVKPGLPGFDQEAAVPDSDAAVQADIAALERELGAIWDRISEKNVAPGEIFIRAEDFEPEEANLRTDDPTEILREVTHEIVREVHHHHHHEAEVPAPGKAVPRSAAEASQIGPIQFASDWKTRGGG